ncbi:MAG: pyrimidine/purine nucleoside phosphorylase [Deltaproteobacteria bacterium]|nr:pyrimidine/purine nucleoside phosphorylase [Deltaproteobacteria bacterium]
MSSQFPTQFENVRVQCKANIYFDGKVVSHSIFFADGSKKTIGVMLPGTFDFKTAGPERMEITAGSCRVRIGDAKDFQIVTAGSDFRIAGNSSFVVVVDQGSAEYICSFE